MNNASHRYDADTAKRCLGRMCMTPNNKTLNPFRFFDCILSRGNTLDPAEGFRMFRGRDVDQHALLVKRGFA